MTVKIQSLKKRHRRKLKKFYQMMRRGMIKQVVHRHQAKRICGANGNKFVFSFSYSLIRQWNKRKSRRRKKTNKHVLKYGSFIQ